MTSWFSKSIFWFPAIPQSSGNGDAFDSKMPSQLSQASSFSSYCKHSIYPSILGLLIPGSPFAIFRVVAIVVVFSLKRQPRRSLSHISQKILKRMPPLAHFYSSSAVSRVCLAVWVIASLLHTIPDAIDRSPIVPPGMSVPKAHFSRKAPFDFEAAAGSGVPAKEFRNSHRLHGSAGTFALVSQNSSSGDVTNSCNRTYYGESSEGFSSEWGVFWHGVNVTQCLVKSNLEET